VLPQGIRPFLCDLPRTGGRCAPERVLVISQFLPDAPWAGHQAIARTVVAYALADAIVVVAADADRGGTWIGALEGLRKRRPVFVRRLRHDDRSCPGNARLIERGARPLPDDAEQAAAEILLRFGPTCGSRETPT
jgi:predicted Rossmann fold nucleotide-binding protein DprA/Smf involved in DNA uptake